MKNFLKIVSVYAGAFSLAQRACVAYIWLLFKYAFIWLRSTGNFVVNHLKLFICNKIYIEPFLGILSHSFNHNFAIHLLIPNFTSFFWPLCFLFFLDIGILITPLIFPNSSY
jgi:hypothetical protein